ncbi:MAG: LamB/YcsF family protein [Acidimicrobiales bacterium]
MINTWSMVTVDLNADLAEGEVFTDRDLEVLRLVSSVSIACGFHAGGPGVMRAATSACVELGVAIGAHVAFRDREGFGRRHVARPVALLVEDIVEQCALLTEQAAAAGGHVTFVKPHGALYHCMGVEQDVAEAVVEAVCRSGIGIVVAQAGTIIVGPARRHGIRVVPEGFPDRAYLPDGRLAPRDRPGALVEDPSEVGRRAVSLALGRRVEAVDGTWASVDAETLCIHGDSPGAAPAARSVRAALEARAVGVRPFAAGPASGSRSP